MALVFLIVAHWFALVVCISEPVAIFIRFGAVTLPVKAVAPELLIVIRVVIEVPVPKDRPPLRTPIEPAVVLFHTNLRTGPSSVSLFKDCVIVPSVV